MGGACSMFGERRRNIRWGNTKEGHYSEDVSSDRILLNVT